MKDRQHAKNSKEANNKEALEAEVRELAWNVLDERATDQDYARLDELLAGSDHLQQCYLSVCELHFEFERRALSEEMVRHSDSTLASQNLTPDEPMVTPAKSSHLRKAGFIGRLKAIATRPTPVSISVALLVVGGFVASLALIYPEVLIGTKGGSRVTAMAEEVATLSELNRVVWNEDSNRPQGVRSRLKVGDRISLTSGAVLVRYDTGAKAVLEGPAEYRVTGKNAGFLRLGRLLATVETKTAHGFTVDTPPGRITDLGTEFGVDVNASSDARIDVFEGRVVVETHDSSSGQRGSRTELTAGNALVIGGGDGAIALIKAVGRNDFSQIASKWRNELALDFGSSSQDKLTQHHVQKGFLPFARATSTAVSYTPTEQFRNTFAANNSVSVTISTTGARGVVWRDRGDMPGVTLGDVAEDFVTTNTEMVLTLGGLPKGRFIATTFHHDMQAAHGTINVAVDDALGKARVAVPRIAMTGGVDEEPSQATFEVHSDGQQPVVLYLRRIDSKHAILNGIRIVKSPRSDSPDIQETK